jgi:hypothetical protein
MAPTVSELRELAHQCRVRARDRIAVDLAIAVQDYFLHVNITTPEECPECARRKALTLARVRKFRRGAETERQGKP